MPTIREILTDAIPRLEQAGVDSPRLDAEVLLAHVVGKDRGWLWAHPEFTLAATDIARFNDLLARRVQREPLAYLLGEWEFYGRPFTVTPDVLVPRPETELLVEAVASWVRAHHASVLADIGAGSGAIAVTLALELPQLRVIAVDLSPRALEVARSNAARHGVQERLTFLEGDLLQPLRESGITALDAIVANLPYIAEEEMATLMPEVRDYEPSLALQAGDGGLALIRRLLREAPPLLACDGLLALELGMGQSEQVKHDLQSAGWRDITVIADYCGIPRHLLAIAPIAENR